MKRFSNVLLVIIAAVYFFLDALFAWIALPIARWISARLEFTRLARWIRSLSPYPTLLLFFVPLIVLEPVKPLAAYLAGTGRLWLGLGLLVVAEILKLVLVERLFSISRDKLMSIPAFAWGFGKYTAVRDWFTALEAWQRVQRFSRITRYAVHRTMRQFRGTGPRACLQSR